MSRPSLEEAREWFRVNARPGVTETTLDRLALCCHAAGVFPAEAFRRAGRGSLRAGLNRNPVNIESRALVWWLARNAFLTVPSFEELSSASGRLPRSWATIGEGVRWVDAQIQNATDHPVVSRAASALQQIKATPGAAA